MKKYSWTLIIAYLLLFENQAFAGTNDGIFRSTDDGTSCTNVEFGFPISSDWLLAVSDSNIFSRIVGEAVFLYRLCIDTQM